MLIIVYGIFTKKISRLSGIALLTDGRTDKVDYRVASQLKAEYKW